MSNDLTKTKSRLSYKYQKIFDLLNKIWGRAELSHLHSISLFVWKLLVCRIFCCEETRMEYRDSECWAHIKPSWRSGKCPGAVEWLFFLLMFLSSFLSKIQLSSFAFRQLNWTFDKFKLLKKASKSLRGQRGRPIVETRKRKVRPGLEMLQTPPRWQLLALTIRSSQRIWMENIKRLKKIRSS